MKTIGIIGLGNMGSVIATIAAKHETYPVLLANRTHEKAVNLAEKLNATAVTNRQVFEQANVIFLGVKPNQIEELLEENKNIEKVIQFVYGNSVVVENLEVGTKLLKKGFNDRIVTLEGDIITSRGRMTGGHSFKGKDEILERKKELKHLEIEIEKE